MDLATEKPGDCKDYLCRIDSQLLLGIIYVGLHAAGLQALYLPSLKNKERACDRDIDGLMAGASYMCKARSWSKTPPCMAGSRDNTRQQALLPGAGGSYQ